MLGVMNLHSDSAGPDMLLLLLKALISISASSSPVSNPPLILHSHTQPTRKYHFNRIEVFTVYAVVTPTT